MAKTAENEGFRMLDEFVCKAIHDPKMPLAKSEKQGKNAGMLILEAIVLDATNADNAGGNERENPGKDTTINDTAGPSNAS